MKRVLSSIFAIVLVIMMIPTINVQATVTIQSPPNEGWARIRYAGNGKYLDIPSEGFYNNGTQLQIWDYAYGNQNQIFYFHNTGNGWQISSHLTGKVIEVRNSSHQELAQVAQWDKHELACARWDIIANLDGTVSFKNRESGLYLNVLGGGNAPNGTKIIQYHNDETVAMKFYLEGMANNDVLSATFERYTKVGEIKWNKLNTPYVKNQTGWSYTSNGTTYYPAPGQGLIFQSAEYLSPNTVATMIRNKSYNQSLWKELLGAIKDEAPETAISIIISKLGLKDIPGVGYAVGIYQVLLDSQENAKWNRFVNAAQVDSQGRYSGVIVYTYYEITATERWDEIRPGASYANMIIIEKKPYVEYKTWTGDNFSSVRGLPVTVRDGRWHYNFK